MARQDTLADTRSRFVPLQWQLAFLRRVVQRIMPVVHVIDLGLLQAIKPLVRMEVTFDILCHGLGLRHHEVVPQRKEVQHAVAIFARDVPSHSPLHEANAKAHTPCPAPVTWQDGRIDWPAMTSGHACNAVRVIGICLDEPNARRGQLVQRLGKVVGSTTRLFQEVVEFPERERAQCDKRRCRETPRVGDLIYMLDGSEVNGRAVPRRS